MTMLHYCATLSNLKPKLIQKNIIKIILLLFFLIFFAFNHVNAKKKIPIRLLLS